MGATCAVSTKNTLPTAGEGEHFARILLLGESETGKTSLARRYFYGDYTRPRNETLVPNHFNTRTIKINKTRVDLELVDMAGCSSYENVSDVWFTECNAVLLVCDVTRPETLESLDTIMEKLKCIFKENLEQIPVVVAANKVDLLEKSKKASITFRNYPVFQTSAKEDVGVREAFSELLKLSMKK